MQNLGTRVGQLERQLATQTTEAEIMGRRIADMEMRLTEQARLLADRERERDQLRVDVDSARRIEADLRQELGTIERRNAQRHRGAARREDDGRDPARARARGSRQAAARSHQHEARGGGDLGVRAGRERAAARAHQRRGGGSGAAHLGAGRARLADRHDPRGARAPRHERRRQARSRRRRTPTPRTARAASPIASAPCRRARRGFPPRRDRARALRPSIRGPDRHGGPRLARARGKPRDRQAPRGRAQDLHRRRKSSTASSRPRSAPNCGWRGRADRIRKYHVPVRVYVDNRGKPDRSAQVASVVADIRSRVAGSRHRDDDGPQRPPMWKCG